MRRQDAGGTTGGAMAEWEYAQDDPSEELAQLQFFSVKQKGGAEFVITVKEYATPKSEQMRFFATSERNILIEGVPMAPFGWGTTLLKALMECIKQIQQNPCEEK
jgi:hypothetical protein